MSGNTAPDQPVKPEWFSTAAEVGAVQMAKHNRTKAEWLAAMKELSGDTEGHLDPHADALWEASLKILKAELDAFNTRTP